MGSENRKPHWVKDMPGFVWLCISLGWMLFIVLFLTHISKNIEMSKSAENIIWLVIIVPWFWFIGVRVFDFDND